MACVSRDSMQCFLRGLVFLPFAALLVGCPSVPSNASTGAPVAPLGGEVELTGPTVPLSGGENSTPSNELVEPNEGVQPSDEDSSSPPPIDTQTPSPNGAKSAVFVSIVMHVEEPPGYPNFEEDRSVFDEHRAALVEFVNMLARNGVKFNYQSDWNFLKAVAKYDTGTPDTLGKNVLRYLKEDLGVEVDPHAHETLYNYADVAYLIEQLGINPSGIVGGFIADPPRDSQLERFWEPISGDQYPSYTWQAQALWGGGTGNHVNEGALWVSGVWKPKDRGHFLDHDSASPLPNLGNFGGQWDNLDLLLALHGANLLADGIHTCTIMTNQRDIVDSEFILEFESQLQSRRGNAAIRWVGLSELLAIWEDEFNAQSNVLSYEEAASMSP